MKPGKQVVYVKGRARKTGTITEITGSGPSGYKTLSLQFAKGTAKDVPHRQDDAGQGYWQDVND